MVAPGTFGASDRCWIGANPGPPGLAPNPPEAPRLKSSKKRSFTVPSFPGFYSYHLAEHHATPLGLAPAPGIFFAAATQRTRRIRLGPCVYCLPFYDPLRLIEEVCML